MSADTAPLPCPICAHVGKFNTVQSLRDRLIYVSTNTLTCPVCQEEVSGLDKLTIHLFSHVKLSVVEDKQKSVPRQKKKCGSQVNAEPAQKKSVVNTKNSTQSCVTSSTVKYVKICPKPPNLSIRNVSIISVPQDNNSTNVQQTCDHQQLSTANESNCVCEVCGLKFPDSKKLEIHALVHNNKDMINNASKFRCHVCPKIFKMRGSLMVHLRVAHFGFLTCDLIPNTQKTQNNTSNDTAEIKTDKTINIERNDSKQWQCDVCRKYFTTKYFLKKHKRLHTGETPYACAQCNKTFTFQQSYHKHLLYHNDEKPHICNYCGRAFKELSTLHNHQRIHTGEKPFSCETCGKSFRQRVSYLVHRRIHTGVMPYKCTACSKSFRYKVSQRTHKCLAQPPGTVVRQPGELVEKLKKKQINEESVPKNSNMKSINQVEDQINGNINHCIISEANAELIRSGAKLSLEDMESEYFKLLPESSHESSENSLLTITNHNNSFPFCDDLFNANLTDFIDCIQENEKNIPSPSDILKKLCLSTDEQNDTFNK